MAHRLLKAAGRHEEEGIFHENPLGTRKHEGEAASKAHSHHIKAIAHDPPSPVQVDWARSHPMPGELLQAAKQLSVEDHRAVHLSLVYEEAVG